MCQMASKHHNARRRWWWYLFRYPHALAKSRDTPHPSYHHHHHPPEEEVSCSAFYPASSSASVVVADPSSQTYRTACRPECPGFLGIDACKPHPINNRRLPQVSGHFECNVVKHGHLVDVLGTVTDTTHHH